MAATYLTSADFGIAFAFGRAEAASFRDAEGVVQTAAPGTPRFDHDATGAPLGLLTGAGADFGGGDRLSIDPLMLPAALADFAAPQASDATVFHHHDAGTGPVRRAWYSRNARATIDSLLRLPGHHLQIGVIAGLRAAEDGAVRYRGEAWLLPPLVTSTGAALAAAAGKPLIACGAEPPAGG